MPQSLTLYCERDAAGEVYRYGTLSVLQLGAEWITVRHPECSQPIEQINRALWEMPATTIIDA